MPRGVPIKKPRRAWPQNHLERLPDLAEKHSIPVLAKRLGRTEAAVKTKFKLLGISQQNRSGWFTAQEVCQMLGVDRPWLTRRGLRMVPHNPERPPRRGKSTPWEIRSKDLREFIRAHPQELVGRRVDIVMLVDVLAGIRPTYQRSEGTET